MNPKIYLVGGAVRDILLGFTPKDRDYVVVGANHDWMISQGFQQVGLDFPVYIHPETGEEYALARREKKVGTGYNGFETETENVSLEEDLFRRDLTINAMAMDDAGNLIDPYSGQDDLKKGILRHVSNAFGEDPLRVLRLARFAARYNFNVAKETTALCCKIVCNNELDEIDPNRFWKEINRAVQETYALRFFNVLCVFRAFEECYFIRTIFQWQYSPLWNEVFSYATKFENITGNKVPTDVILALISNGLMDEETEDELLVPSNVKYLRRQRERLFEVPSTPDMAEIVDFLIKSRALQKGNDVGDLVSMIDVMVYTGEVSYINSVIMKYGIEHLGKLEFVADPKLKGKEIGKAKRKFYEEHLVKKFALLRHTIGV